MRPAAGRIRQSRAELGRLILQPLVEGGPKQADGMPQKPPIAASGLTGPIHTKHKFQGY
jgi:hypothetical protein